MASRGVRGTAEVREVGIDSECSLEEGECSSTPVLGKNRKAPAQEEEFGFFGGIAAAIAAAEAEEGP